MRVKRILILIKTHLFYILPLAIALWALLCTVYSDTMVQNGGMAPVTLPWASILFPNEKASLDEIAMPSAISGTMGVGGKATEAGNTMTYIFVLDVSASAPANPLDDTLKNKFHEMISELRDSSISLKDVDEPKLFHFSVVRTFYYLMNLHKNSPKEKEIRFAIWTVGDEAVQIVPSPKKAQSIVLTKEQIVAASTIQDLNVSKFKGDGKTDFECLFRRLLKNYPDELAVMHGPWDEPSFIVTILSDHKPDLPEAQKKSQSTTRLEDFTEGWRKLENHIRDLSNCRTIVNLVSLPSEKGKSERKTLISLFSEAIDSYRLNSYTIKGEEPMDLLFPVSLARGSIDFYYTNPREIENASFTIQSNADGKHLVRIDVLQGMTTASSARLSLVAEHLGAEGDQIGTKAARIFVGSPPFEAPISKNQQIRLSYSGRLPQQTIAPMLRISRADKQRSYLVHIDFVKRLPPWAALIFIIVNFIITTATFQF